MTYRCLASQCVTLPVVPDVDVVSAELEARLAAGPWTPEPRAAPATEVAAFALGLSGKRRQARRSGRLGRLIARFALAACLALASVSAACQKPDATGDDAIQAISAMPYVSASEATITQSQPRASPAQFTDLLLVDPGSDSQPWAVFVPQTGGDTPILMDRVGAGADQVGSVYRVAAQPVKVGTRDGTSEFLDPLIPGEASSTGDAAQGSTAVSRWQEDERYLAATRAIAGQPTVLDAAYNAEAAANAGGTHSYSNGVVLRVEPDKPVVEVIDKSLLESGKPTRAEDIVYVAIRPQEQSLYSPGQVVNLRDVVMDAQKTDIDGQPTTVYIANAALDGSRVEPTGATVDLQGLLTPRLQQLDQDLAAQAEADPTAAQAQPTATAATPAVVQQPVIVNRGGGGGSFVGDFLLFMWLTNGGFYSRGPNVIINNPPPSPYRTGDIFYSPPPAPSGSSPSTTQSAQADARNTALQASRSAVSGQAAGSGGGVAATSKSASESSARVSAATSKAAVAAAVVSTASSGKSISSAPASSSSTASRSAGAISAGSRGSAGGSSSGSSSIGRSSSGSSGGFGGKGVGSSGSS
jgi:hypothetical protein